MKKLIIFITILFSSLLFIIKPKAYVMVETSDGRFDPDGKAIISSGSFNWGEGNQFTNARDPWVYSLGQYFSAGALQGSNLIVDADYYFGVRALPFTETHFNNYLDTTRNTLTSSNLRCGIGTYGNGYDSTYIPEVQNFNVSYEEESNATGQYFLIHVKFTYKQQIKSVLYSSNNISCWFERNPSNGLALQPVSSVSAYDFYYYSYTKNLRFAVTDDPNTKLLNELTNQNQTIINQNEETNNKLNDLNNKQDATNGKLDDLNNNIKDDSIDTEGTNSFFDNFDDTDHGGLSSIVTAPLTLFSKITETCSPITFTVLEKEITLPCGDTLFWNKSSVSAFRVIWNILLGGPILYMLLIKLYKTIEGLKNPDDDRIEVTDL